MIIYLCIKYESNTLIFSKDIERKPFYISNTDGTDVRTDILTDSGDTIYRLSPALPLDRGI